MRWLIIHQCINVLRMLKAPWTYCISVVPPGVGQAFHALAFGITLYPNHNSWIRSNRSFEKVHVHCSRHITVGCQHLDLAYFHYHFQDGQMDTQMTQEPLQVCRDSYPLASHSFGDSSPSLCSTDPFRFVSVHEERRDNFSLRSHCLHDLLYLWLRFEQCFGLMSFRVEEPLWVAVPALRLNTKAKWLLKRNYM